MDYVKLYAVFGKETLTLSKLLESVEVITHQLSECRLAILHRIGKRAGAQFQTQTDPYILLLLKLECQSHVT